MAAGFVFSMLVFFLGGEVISYVVSFLVSSLVDSSRMSQSSMDGVVGGPISYRY